MGAVRALCQQRNKLPGSPVSASTMRQALVLQSCFLEGASVSICLRREALQGRGENLLDEHKEASSQSGKSFCLLNLLKTRK